MFTITDIRSKQLDLYFIKPNDLSLDNSNLPATKVVLLIIVVKHASPNRSEGKNEFLIQLFVSAFENSVLLNV